MALTVYKISEYTNWKANSPSSYGSGSGASVDLSNYYTISQLTIPGQSHVDFANIVNAYHNDLLGLQGGLEYSDSAPPDSDDSSGVPDIIHEYYHLDYANYQKVLAMENLWLEDSIGDLYTVTEGAGVYIDDIFIKNSIIDAQDGSLKHLTVTAGDAIGVAGTDAGNLILKAGNSILADANSLPGSIQLVPGNNYNVGQTGHVYLGDSYSNFSEVRFDPLGLASNVGLSFVSKGNGMINIQSDFFISFISPTVAIEATMVSIGGGWENNATIQMDSAINVDGYDLTIHGSDVILSQETGPFRGGNVILKGGTRAGVGTGGMIYLVPGDNNGISDQNGYIYFGDSVSTNLTQSIRAEGAGDHVSMQIMSKGNGTLLLGSDNGEVGIYAYSSDFYIGTTLIRFGVTSTNFEMKADTSYGVSNVELRISASDADYDTSPSEVVNGGDILLHGGIPYNGGSTGRIFLGTGSAGTNPLAGSGTGTSYLAYNRSTGQVTYADGGGGPGGGVSLSGSTNNTVCTVTGTDAIQGEANLTFDGTDLTNSAGDMYADNFDLNSDERLKTNIEPYKPKYIDIEYKRFEFKSDLGQIHYGVIAQELQKTHPELIRERSDGMLAVSTDLLFMEIAYLKERIRQLENG